jgi:hypothetical protein
MLDNTNPPAGQHPDEWRYDLNPNAGAGENVGLIGPHPEKAAGIATAFDIKDLHARLPGYTDDELKQIVIMPFGSRLEQGATYLDLAADTPQPFTATGDMTAGPNHWYVPKTELGYVLWNRLTGVETPERLDQADEA